MADRIEIERLRVDSKLYKFINDEVLPDLGLNQIDFWHHFDQIIYEFSPLNEKLMQKRATFEEKINRWHTENKSFDREKYKAFLFEIGYLLKEVDDFKITTDNVDDAIAAQAGPQLVVPVSNARYAINACNARWGSLYDALYGTDAILPIDNAARGYDKNRGDKVIAYAKAFLDKTLPLTQGHWDNVGNIELQQNKLVFRLLDGTEVRLKNTDHWVGFSGQAQKPEAFLFKQHRLHIEIVIDPEGNIGKNDPAHIQDINLEAALTTIQDCEDSVAAVDAEDKLAVYRNWFGLMKGDLSVTFEKSGKSLKRAMNPDKCFTSPTGSYFSLSSRSLMLVRNVGLLMKSDLILDEQNQPIPEGIIDAMVTVLCAVIEVENKSLLTNSSCGNIYVVKPKLHGPEEVNFTCQLFCEIEDALGLIRNTVKIGIMDEERRTSLNLKNCIAEAKERVIFINTGFLDRTGDEIHTSMVAGPFIDKQAMKSAKWIQAYEASNVEIGLQAGLSGLAQIGKGMWAMPDEMNKMLKEKIVHPLAGASTAWVPSPTAAVLHALHYHDIDVFACQNEILHRPSISRDELLELALIEDTYTDQAKQQELDNNVQGILGYVVRWVDQGVGCSKVPDIHNVGLMEDRATLRISSQFIANWLFHGLYTEAQVNESLARMAKVVDEQNNNDANYRPLYPLLDEHPAYKAAKELIFEGASLPNGYTEPVLHKWRLAVKNTPTSP